jgi:Txe/YoeB family toxin of toxin-antitoxin system
VQHSAALRNLAADRKMAVRITRLIGEIRRDPFAGIGKPGPLKGDLSGYWARRIDDETGFACIRSTPLAPAGAEMPRLTGLNSAHAGPAVRSGGSCFQELRTATCAEG